MTQFNFKDQLVEEIILSNALNRRIVTINEEIDRDSIFKSKHLIERIVNIDKEQGLKPYDCKPITIRINSYGGCASNTMYFVAYIEHLKEIGYIVNTEALAVCMSGGFKILIAGSNRSSYKYCDIMVHQPNSFKYGHETLKDKQIDYEATKKMWNMLKDFIVENTGITHKQLDKSVKENINWHMTPQEALELSVIDEII